MKGNNLLVTMAAVLGLSLAGVAFADDQPSFDQVDTNADGVISKTEASKVAGLDFAKADRDQDGQLSRSEYEDAIS